MQDSRFQAGMTLPELMVTLSIMSILLAIAIPSTRSLSETEAVRSQVNAFISTLRYARSEAIRYRTQIVVCPSNNSESAVPACSAGAHDDWSQGWLVFVNRNGDTNYAFDASNDTLLRVQGPMAASGGIINAAGGNPANKFVFRSTGTLKVGGASAYTFDSASDDAARRQRICISLPGRIRTSSDPAACS